MAVVKAHKSLVKAALKAAKKDLPPDEVKAEETPVVEVPAEETPAPVETPPETPAPKIPLGAEMLASAHSHLAEWITYCDENLASLENEEVAAELLDICEGVYEKLASISALYSAQYPDLDPLPEVEQPGEEKAEGDETEKEDGEEKAEDEDEIHAGESDEIEGKNPALIAALAGGAASGVLSGVTSHLLGGGKDKALPGKSYSGEVKRLTKAFSTTIKECADHLTEMKDAENLTGAQKLVCKHYSKELGAMCEQKEQVPEVEDKGDAGEEEIEKAYEALSDEDKKAFETELAAWVEQQEVIETHNKRLADANARRCRRV